MDDCQQLGEPGSWQLPATTATSTSSSIRMHARIPTPANLDDGSDDPPPPYTAADPLATISSAQLPAATLGVPNVRSGHRHSLPSIVDWTSPASPSPAPSPTPLNAVNAPSWQCGLGAPFSGPYFGEHPPHPSIVAPYPPPAPRPPHPQHFPHIASSRPNYATPSASEPGLLHTIDSLTRSAASALTSLSSISFNPRLPPPPSIHVPPPSSANYVYPMRRCAKCHDMGWKPSGRPCRRCPVGRAITEEIRRSGRAPSVVRICDRCQGTGRVEVRPFEWNMGGMVRIGSSSLRAQVQCARCLGRGTM